MYIILYTDRVRVVDLIKVRRWGRGSVGYLINRLTAKLNFNARTRDTELIST